MASDYANRRMRSPTIKVPKLPAPDAPRAAGKRLRKNYCQGARKRSIQTPRRKFNSHRNRHRSPRRRKENQVPCPQNPGKAYFPQRAVRWRWRDMKRRHSARHQQRPDHPQQDNPIPGERRQGHYYYTVRYNEARYQRLSAKKLLEVYVNEFLPMPMDMEKG